jgi:predicted nicotinamide N-methyase
MHLSVKADEAGPPPAGEGESMLRYMEFIRSRTALTRVPLVPEIELYQATELTELWRATAADLEKWDDSPFWAFPWAGGQALARHVLDHPELVAGLRVADFGTGSGLVAIAASKAGASRVVAFDVDPFCEAAVRLNTAHNGVAVEFQARSPLGTELPAVDVVLAGDVFYQRDMAERFLVWGRMLAGRGVRVLAGDPGRLYSPQQGVRDRGSHDVPTSTAIEDRVLMKTWILELLPE